MKDSLLYENIRKNTDIIGARIHKAMHAAARKDAVRLVAISKFHPAEAIMCAALCGHTDFGENYVQEALEKQSLIQAHAGALPPLQWHFTGHIQSRKAKDVVGRFDLIHSLDSTKLADGLQKAAAQKNKEQAVLIQVNVGDEAQKSGVSTSQLLPLAEHVAQCPNLILQGLMCLPPVFDAGLAARPWFALLRQLRDTLSVQLNQALPHLSMGMSGDLEAAILEGATLVRVGTDIFGMR